MGMSRAAKMMMMGRGNSDGYRENDDYQSYNERRGYDERRSYGDHYKGKEEKRGGKIRAGGTFWMDSPEKDMKFDRKTAERWVSEMDKPDGGKGGKWTYEQAEQLMKQKGYNCDPSEFWAALNMMHSDYGKTLAKYGVTSPDAYAELAYNWLDDKDIARPNEKMALYYHCIVK